MKLDAMVWSMVAIGVVMLLVHIARTEYRRYQEGLAEERCEKHCHDLGREHIGATGGACRCAEYLPWPWPKCSDVTDPGTSCVP